MLPYRHNVFFFCLLMLLLVCFCSCSCCWCCCCCSADYTLEVLFNQLMNKFRGWFSIVFSVGGRAWRGNHHGVEVLQSRTNNFFAWEQFAFMTELGTVDEISVSSTMKTGMERCSHHTSCCVCFFFVFSRCCFFVYDPTNPCWASYRKLDMFDCLANLHIECEQQHE